MKTTPQRDERGYLLMPNDMLLKCAQLFMKVGIRSVSMDDVSRHLGISKKTLYQFVSNKGELIAKVIQLKVTEIEADLDTIFSQSPNAIEAFIAYCNYVVDNYSWMNPKAVHDLQKYYPTGWSIYEDHLHVFSLKRIAANLKTGAKEGDFRKNIETDIIASIFLRVLLELFTPQNFPTPNHTTKETMKAFLRYHLHGICTPKGLKIVDVKA